MGRPVKSLEWVEKEGCHVVTSHIPNNSGYCSFYREGELWLIHRYVYTKHHGDIPKNMVVMHTCDNRRCINPSHLKLGTPKENTRDIFEKEREAVHQRKRINFKNCIRELRKKKNITVKELAQLVNLSPNYFSMLELNQRGCSVEKAIEIAHVLGTTVEDLFTKEERDDVRTRLL